MKFFKATAMALVIGAGFALVTTQAARAQESAESSSTYTSSFDGNSESLTLGAGISDTQIDATSTSGTAIAAAIATPLFTASGGASIAGGSAFIAGTGPESQDFTAPVAGGCGLFGCTDNIAPSYGAVLSGGSFVGGLHIDNGHSDTLALNHIALWIEAEASSTQGSATTSGTSSTGISVAGLFVFGQTLAVPTEGSLTDSSPTAPIVSVASGDFNDDSGAISLNQVAGVGNQQGNNLSVFAEVTGEAGSAAGSNSVNVEGSQTLADSGVIGNDYGTGGESATIYTNAFQGITGAVTFNQAAGVANQQVNNLTVGR